MRLHCDPNRPERRHRRAGPRATSGAWRPLNELQQLSESILDELVERFPMGYRPVIQWKALRVSAGIAYTRSGRIALSTRVLKDAESMRETLVHEYAHLLAVARHGREGAGHGAPWRQAMHDLGAIPTVRHKMPVERNQPRQQVHYRCKKCGALIIRNRRLPKGRKYMHSKCGGAIKLEAVRPITEGGQSA